MPASPPQDGSSVVSTRVADGVAVVSIRRPHVRNAMDWSVFDELAATAARLESAADVHAVLLAGAGGTFSSGLDVSLFGAAGPDGVDGDFITRLQQAFNAWEDLGVPTVAAIEGHCLGAGAQLAAACHLRLVADDAQIAFAERRWGLVPDLGGTWRLPRLIGLGHATEWMMTGRMVGADEAVSRGFAQGRFTDLAAAESWVRTLAQAPGATRRLPALLRDNLGRGRHEALAAEAAVQLECLAGPDVAEAAAAMRDGRAPRFVGR